MDIEKPSASPDEALSALLARLRPVDTESVGWRQAAGRVLAQPVAADRDNPPCDNSAMDGYAVRLADLSTGSVPVAGEVLIGREPPALPPGQALRIVTGAALPADAEAVIPREDVDEQPGQIVLRPGIKVKPGQHIRRQGENVPQHHPVLDAGRAIDGAVMAAVAAFGVAQLLVHRRVKVAVIVTGNELRPPESSVQPWELRDSNGPALMAFLSGMAQLEPPRLDRAGDDPAVITQRLKQALDDCDAVLLTGGVSVGQHDYVPQAVAAAGAEVLFRRLPIRPGHPMLGAVGHGGQPILGLPGNPLSVMVAARRFAAVVLRHLAGVSCPSPPLPTVTLANPDQKRLPLWWYRPVRLTSCGVAELAAIKGSGDLVGAARSDGFIEIPPHGGGAGPWPFWRW